MDDLHAKLDAFVAYKNPGASDYPFDLLLFFAAEGAAYGLIVIVFGHFSPLWKFALPIFSAWAQ